MMRAALRPNPRHCILSKQILKTTQCRGVEVREASLKSGVGSRVQAIWVQRQLGETVR